MSAHMKMPLTKGEITYKIVIEIPGKKKKLSFISEKNLHKLEAFLDKYGESESESIEWQELAKKRLAKYKKSGLALRGARYREGMSQKELAERSGVSQENISKMEKDKEPSEKMS